MLATAFEEGLIRSNPAAGLRIAWRIDSDGAGPKGQGAHRGGASLTEEELQKLIEETESEHRLLVRFLAATGLRISEALALAWGDLDLGKRRVQVRRRVYRGAVAPPKSRYGIRSVPLSQQMARELWELRKSTRASDELPMFASDTGTMFDQTNLLKRVLKPAAKQTSP